jgi:hypothetical protein
MTPRRHPACMTEAEHMLWERANRVADKRAESPCWDCPMAWAEQMRALDACDGTPGQTRKPGRPWKVRRPPGRPRLPDTKRRIQWRESKRRMRALRRLEAA